MIPAAERAEPAPRTPNLLLDFYDTWLRRAIDRYVPDPAPQLDPVAFSPGYALPDLAEDTREFFAAATAEWRDLPGYRDRRLVLLDLTANPSTHTTKTFASLLIVARAVEYTRRSGEPVVIFSPTSANKGTALRDAVARAYDAGLATPEQLRVVVLAPHGCRDKLRGSVLTADERLRAANPLLLYTGAHPESVKALGREVVREHGERFHLRTGARLWYSLDLSNYLLADTGRAFAEWAADPTGRGGRPRWHAHAVSSAFGLLGYHAGRSVLEAAGVTDAASRPASLLVQHLGTPDMVLHLRYGTFDRANLPSFTADPVSGLLRQSADPHFPFATYAVDEVLDPTFYTHEPATSPDMDAIIKLSGGDGIVVSLYECLTRYAEVRALLRAAGTARGLPADPRSLREWSVIMALTGVLNAIDRDLIEPAAEVVVHGSGWYTVDECTPIEPAAVTAVAGVDDVASVLLDMVA